MGLATVGFELGTAFYNAILPDLVSQDRVGRVSGWGWGVGYAGGLACLALSYLVFVAPDPPLFGLDPRRRSMSASSCRWPRCGSRCLPCRSSCGYPTCRRAALRWGRSSGAVSPHWGARCGRVRRHGNIIRFLLAKMIYIDGLNTLFIVGGACAAGAFSMSIDEVLIFGIILNVTAGAGAIGFAWVDDWIGAKPTILIALAAIALLGGGLLFVERQALVPTSWPRASASSWVRPRPPAAP